MAKGNSSRGDGGNKGGQTHPQPQSAKTGRFVTQDYANKHPNTTFTEKPKPSKKP